MAEHNGKQAKFICADKPVEVKILERRLCKYAKHMEYCAVYIFAVCDKGPTKIGISVNPRSRLSGVNTDCPDDVVSYAVYWFWGPPVAEGVESKCHKLLKAKHRKREWFNISTTEASKMVARVAADTDMEWFTEDERIKKLTEMADKFLLW